MSKKIFGMFRRKAGAVYSGRGEEFLYWKRYVYRQQLKAMGAMKYTELVGPKQVGKKNWYYTEDYPWTTLGKDNNSPGSYTPNLIAEVEPIKEMHIFIGDRVEILVGKDKGKVEEVVEVIPERNWCFCEGSHVENKIQSLYPFNKGATPGHLIVKEKPLLITSEVQLVDPADQKRTEIEWRYTESGERVRVSLRTGRIIPIPSYHKSVWEDFTNTASYKASEKDTPDDALTEVTMKPKLCTFEEDILQNSGIEDKPRINRSFWY